MFGNASQLLRHPPAALRLPRNSAAQWGRAIPTLFPWGLRGTASLRAAEPASYSAGLPPNVPHSQSIAPDLCWVPTLEDFRMSCVPILETGASQASVST